jgi:hypothetical protein
MALMELGAWTTQLSAANIGWRGVTYGNDIFIAVAESGSLTRAMISNNDGLNWYLANTPNYAFRGVAYGNERFVAVASNGTYRVMVSTNDGLNWNTYLSDSNIAAVHSNAWTSVVFGNNIFVAVAESGTGNRIMTSADGNIWTIQTSPADNSWRSVTYGNGIYVAVASTGSENRAMYSNDGISWTLSSTSNNNWLGVTYGNGIFVAVAGTTDDVGSTPTQKVMTSSDGNTWTLRDTPVNYNIWTGVAYGGGMFVAVSAYTSAVNDVIFSYDGITWNSMSTNTTNVWRSIAYGNNTFVAVSSTGTDNRVMTSTLQVMSESQPPTLSAFSIPNQLLGNMPFQITPPESNSSGEFTYASSDTSVATITQNMVTMVGVGISTITATQAATDTYESGNITAELQVDASTSDDPVFVDDGDEFVYFLNTEDSTYAHLTASFTVSGPLTSSDIHRKVITSSEFIIMNVASNS